MLKFEMRYHFGQLSYVISGLVFLLLAGFAATTGGFGGSEVHKNAPHVITSIVSLFSLLSIFSATLFCANVVLRDNIYKMDSVIFTTAVRRFPYFVVRFLGLFMAVFSLLAIAVLGISLSTFFVPDTALGSFNLVDYLQPLLIFALPNVCFVCCFIFCTALLTKNIRAIYAAGVLLYILYMVASILGNSPLLANSLKVNDPGVLPFLIDPFGLASFFSETRNWSDLQRNQQLFPVDSIFLINRLLWLSISSLFIFVSYKFFSFRLQADANKKLKKEIAKAVSPIVFRHYKVFPAGFNYHFGAFKSQFKLEVVSLFKHIPFMVMLLLWVFIYGVELKDALFHGPYDIKFYPTTIAIMEEMQSLKFGLILLLFYAAELIGRERSTNMAALVYSTPVKNGVLWGAKCLTLGILVIVLVTANIGIGIGLQLFNGYYTIELSKFLTLYYYSGFPLLLYIFLIVFVQNLAVNKYVGMMLSMLVVFVSVFASRLGIEHYLFRYATIPGLEFSYFNGVGHYAGAFNWYMLYWFAFAVILSVLTIAMWQGSVEQTFFNRLKAIPSFVFRSKIIMLSAIVIWALCAAFIYEQTNVIGNYKNKQALIDWRINYEKKFKPLAKLPQPIIKTVRTFVDLFPSQGKYKVKGNYLLANESDQPINQLWISLNPAVNYFEIAIQNVKHQEIDKKYNQQFIQLKSPLKPGEKIEMKFSFEVYRSGFMPFDSENSLVSNGSYIEMEKFVPHFGYDRGWEIEDKQLRKKEGLPPFKEGSSSDLNYHLIDFETTVSTTEDQQVVTVGNLQKSWVSNNRRYFKYKAPQPINFMFALSSAKYQVKTSRYKDVDLRVYYHSGQEYNVQTILKAMKDMLAYGEANFSAYPLKQLTLAEIPQYKGAATSYPGLIFSAERINFLTDFSDTSKVNQSYAITAHEVAHEWWASILEPADKPGRAMLTESLAKYSEAVLLEKHFGKMYVSKYLKDDQNLYFANSNPNEKEPPLAQVNDQLNIYYQKGGLVLYAIKEVIGEKVLNDVLARLIEQHAAPGPMATTADLFNAVYKIAPQNQKQFINDCFNEVVIYPMQLKVVACKPVAGGKFKLDLTVMVSRERQGAGKPLLPDMDIDLGLFDKDGMFYCKKYRFSKFATNLTIIADKKPAKVTIDPYGYLLDGNLTDNSEQVK